MNDTSVLHSFKMKNIPSLLLLLVSAYSLPPAPLAPPYRTPVQIMEGINMVEGLTLIIIDTHKFKMRGHYLICKERCAQTETETDTET